MTRTGNMTNDELESRAADVFKAALGIDESERASFVERECGDDLALLRNVRSLLDADSAAHDFLSPVMTPPADHAVGSHVGRYRIVRLIAAGGMGVVYEAEQDQPRRTVALKLMKRGITSPSALRRFKHESQILARLRHPGIAQVYDVGIHDGGAGKAPYFVMELIPDAQPITDYAREAALGTRRRLELFCVVCDAVHHGHLRGVIHRDLKPANILVEGRPGGDSTPRPKVIDFGVARVTDADVAVTTMQTDVGQLIGTLQYMSPEQVEADPHDLDVRSDVYALGVVLYELLCERLPYDVSSARIYDATRIIREQSPTRLSTVDRSLRGDLETIALKALEKDRERRYQSAADLGADIRRYLASRPIHARPASASYQLRTFARRNKALVGGVGATMLVLVIGTIGTSIGLVRAAQRANENQRVIDYQAGLLHDMDSTAIGNEIRSVFLEERLDVLRDAGLDESTIEARQGELEGALEDVNLTNVANSVLYEHIYAPALDGVDRFKDLPLLQARMLRTVADNLVHIGMADRAEPALEQALAIYEKERGELHPETLETLKELVSSYSFTHRYDDAIRRTRDLIDRSRRARGGDHPSTLRALLSLGESLMPQGMHDEAMAIFRDVYESAARDGLNDVAWDARANIADVMSNRRDHAGAAVIYRECMDYWGGPAKAQHAAWKLAKELAILDELDEAETLSRIVAESFENERGDDHNMAFAARGNLMGVLRRQYERTGDRAKLEEAYRIGAMNIRRQRDVKGHAGAGFEWQLINVALVLIHMERFKDAESMLREASELVISEESTLAVGPRHGVLRERADRSVILYDAWHQAEPDAGHDEQAAEWRGRRIQAALDHVQFLLDRRQFVSAEIRLGMAIEYIESDEGAGPELDARLRQEVAEMCDTLYEAWHAAEPDAGHDIRGAECRARLEQPDVPDAASSAAP